MGIEPTYFLDLLLKIRADMQLHWGFHTTVVVGVIGWLTAQKSTLSAEARKVATTGYTAFYLLITFMFAKLYWEFEGVRNDFITAITQKNYESFIQEFTSSSKYTEPSFIEHLLTLNCITQFLGSWLILTILFGVVLYLIWGGSIWERSGEKA